MIYHLGNVLYRNAHRIGHEGDRKYIPSPKTRWKSASAGRDNPVNRIPTLGSEDMARRLLKQTRHEAVADDPTIPPLPDPKTRKAKGGE